MLGAASQQDEGFRGDVERRRLGSQIIAGKYQLQGSLGRGGMGVVMRAMHLGLGQPVAIKFLRHDSADSSAAHRLMREARLIAKLGSKYIPRIMDVGTLTDGAPYMVMELLHGETLSEVVRGHGPLPIGAALQHIRQACLGVQTAHTAGVIHRDIKPSNLFLTRDLGGSPLLKVIDFGVARTIKPELEDSPQEWSTVGRQLVGSPPFMSPEQALGEPLDGRSDIWSLGATLHYLLTGKGPFDRSTTTEIVTAILSEPPRALRRDLPDAPAALQRILSRCLQRDPRQRFQSVGAMLAALGSVKSSVRGGHMELEVRPKPDIPTLTTQTELASQGATTLEAESHPPGLAGRAPTAHLVGRDSAAPLGWSEDTPQHLAAGAPRSRPSIDPPMVFGETSAWGPMADGFIVVHGTGNPGKREWLNYIAALEAALPIPGHLVVTAGGGPNAVQRGELTALWKRIPAPPIAVVSASPLVRGMITAVSWLVGDQLKGFSPQLFRDAVSYSRLSIAPAAAQNRVAAILRQFGDDTTPTLDRWRWGPQPPRKPVRPYVLG